MTTKLHPLAVIGHLDFCEGSLQGYVEATYSQLLALLGKPSPCPGDKTTCEWAFKCSDGTQFCVYDWKERTTPQHRYRWHIGGTTPRALEAAQRLLGCHLKVEAAF